MAARSFMKWFPVGELRAWCGLGLLLGCVGVPLAGSAAPQTLYATQFEFTQGFTNSNDLAGQNGWVSSGTGGNGIVEWFVEYNQSAYIGFDPPTTDALFLWKPINHNPTNRPVVTVTLDLAVIDSSTNSPRDEFRWSVYNMAGTRLFSLGFDNRDRAIYHLLDDEVFRDYGWAFDRELVYTIQLRMDFAANEWSAWVGATQVVTNEPITTTNAALTFGDVDAVWVAANTNQAGQYVAGDNFMIFDDLSITAGELPSLNAVMQPPLAVSGGLYLISVNGAEGARYAVEASTNLVNWTALKTNVVTDGYFDFLDRTAAGLPQRFYRARLVP